MPKTKIDYNNTCFYKVVCKDLDITDIYIGHTTELRKRRNCHKHRCNTEECSQYDYKVYKFIRDHGGWDNWEVILIEAKPCESSLEACKHERFLIETYKASLNGNIPTRTMSEWWKDRPEEKREQRDEYKHNWYIDNKERIQIQKHKTIICEHCGSTYTVSNKARHEKTKQHMNSSNE